MAKRASKNQIAAKTAAMFELTSIPKSQVSSIPNIEKTIENTKIEIDAKEMEEMHQAELSEAKQLGIEDTTIIESTVNEISNDFSQKLEESQMRYLEAIEDRDRFKNELDIIKKENQSILCENNKLKSDISQLSSDYNCYQVDTSREITNYKIVIDEYQEKISMYEQNQFNYKLEIAGLKDKIKDLERKINDKAIHEQRKTNGSLLANSQQMFMSRPKYNKSIPISKNGYDSWN